MLPSGKANFQQFINMKILLTSGGTKVPIDEVRHVGNMSKGSFGAQLASALLARSDVDLHYFYAKDSMKPKDVINPETDGVFAGTAELTTFKDLNEYIMGAFNIAMNDKPDIIISAAAVSDYMLDKHVGKISSDGETLTLVFKKAPKVLPVFKKYSPKSMVVGFKLLVSAPYEQVYHAVQKQLRNGVDLVVYNDLTEIKKGNKKRLVFDKQMNFREANNAKELSEVILDHYSGWSEKV
jgi:phosphopantothenate---cysteine ligase (CTP)